jgi:uncharacterized protein YbdZ (MbtH family)
MSGLPKNKREARQWVRTHWADLIYMADMGGVGDLCNDHLDAVWSDECQKIAARLAPRPTPSSPEPREK